MRTLDAVLAWLMVVFGATNLLVRIVPALRWIQIGMLAGGGITLLILGLLNVARTRSRSDGFLRWSGFLSNALALSYAGTTVWKMGTNPLHTPQTLGLVLLVLLETLLSVRK